MKKNALALLLALCMVIAMLPATAFAAPAQELSSVKLIPGTVGELAPAALEPNAKSYSVSLSGGSHGTTELLVDSPAPKGSEVYFLADPDDGYLAEVYVSGIDPEDVLYLGMDIWGFIMPGNKVTIEVDYVQAEGSSHRIKLYSGNGGQAELDRTSAKENESVYLAVLPDKQSGFDPTEHVFATSGLLYYLYMDEDTGIHFYELFMPDEDVNVFVEYKKSGPFRVNAFLTSGDQSATVKIEPQNAYFLDTVTVTITPAPGYELSRVQAVSWAGDLVTDLTPIGNNQYTFTMHPASVDLYIDMETNSYPLTVKCTAGGTATVSTDMAAYGELVSVKPVPDEGYKVKSITEMPNGWWHYEVSTKYYMFTMPNHAVEMLVTFAPIYNPVSVTVENGLGGSAFANVAAAKLGDIVTLTCTPDEGYRVAQITGVENLTDNGDGTYTFTMPDEAANIRVLFLRHENPFLDVNETHFFYDSVLWAVDQGITNGLDDTHFGPFGICNRAQVVTFLWRWAGSPEPTATECPFTDVEAGSWYEKPVLWALENGITNGVSDTEFGADLPCNRAQVVTFLWRMMGQPQSALTEHPFTDVEGGSWYEAPVLWALEHGITTGATESTFNPEGECMRAQVVTFLYRTAQLPPPPAVYTVSAQYDETMGTVTLSHTEAAAGEVITATVTPAEGYLIDWVQCESGTEITVVSETEFTFVMPDHDEVFYAGFAPIETEPTEPVETYELDLRTNGYGEVSYVGERMAAPGESIFFYAIPNPGYELTNVGIFNPNNEIDVSRIQLFEHGDDLYELVMIDRDIIMTCYFTPIA